MGRGKSPFRYALSLPCDKRCARRCVESEKSPGVRRLLEEVACALDGFGF
jgi:hypothetical protein